MKLSQNAQNVISKIETAGFEAWAVGGCVRDLMLGIDSSDVDIASSALPSDIHSVFEKVIDTGIKHGTVTVIYNGERFEITAYRSDGDYGDNRHPENVNFVSDINEDLSRRDFTVNAMAYNENRGLLDLFNGQKDLKNKVIRCVGEPDKRFEEDALRIMRCFRFASKLNFKIEEKTYDSALKKAFLLENISVERIYKEFIGTLKGENPDVILDLLKTGFPSVLKTPKIPKTLQKLKKLSNDESIVLSAHLYLSGCDEKSDIPSSLKTSKSVRDSVSKILKLLKSVMPKTEYDVKKNLDLYGDVYLKALEIKRLVLEEDTDFEENTVKRVISNNEPYRISDLCINGNDLKKIGIKNSDCGKMLSLFLDIVREDLSKNNREYLISLANEYLIH